MKTPIPVNIMLQGAKRAMHFIVEQIQYGVTCSEDAFELVEELATRMSQEHLRQAVDLLMSKIRDTAQVVDNVANTVESTVKQVAPVVSAVVATVAPSAVPQVAAVAAATVAVTDAVEAANDTVEAVTAPAPVVPVEPAPAPAPGAVEAAPVVTEAVEHVEEVAAE